MIVGVVGYRFDYYAYTRNIVGKVPGTEYHKTRDLFAWVNRGAHILNDLVNHEIIPTFDLNNQFYDMNLNRIDLLHLFNGISYGKTPWVSTFETLLPRFKSVIQSIQALDNDRVNKRSSSRAFAVLAGSPCKQVIAMSQCAAQIEKAVLEAHPRFREEIESKMVVMLPPQELLVSQFTDKHLDLDGPIRFMVVGNEFFRKGGREIIETFQSLRERCHYEIELTIVSSLRIGDYAAGASSMDLLNTRRFIEENHDWVNYFPHLPNSETLERMKSSHIGLLPTYADSLGYTVLEFQSTGCPVISTNVRALPEINNNEHGWVIEVPKNPLGEAIYATEAARHAISDCIRRGLEKAIHEIFANRSVIGKKSEQAIQHIRLNHSPEVFATRMREIYCKALS